MKDRLDSYIPEYADKVRNKDYDKCREAPDAHDQHRHTKRHPT